MLYQIHWQFKDGKTEMKAQRDINSTADMKKWEKEVMEDNPLPDGAQWLICNEKSKHFLMAAEP